MLKLKHNEKILKVAKEKWIISYKIVSMRYSADSSSEM